MDKRTLGIILVFGVALMWAIEPIIAKFSYPVECNNCIMDVIQTLGVRTITVALVAAFYVFATKGSFIITKKQFSWFIYMGIFATVIGEFVYLYALTRIPIINAVIIGHTMLIYIIIMTYLFLKDERLTRHDFLGMAIMIIAALMVTTKTISNLSTLKLLTFWDFAVLAASIVWASTPIIVKKYMKGMNVGTIVFYRYGIAAVILSSYLIFNSNFFVSNIFQVLLGLAIATGIILYYEALKRIKAAEVSAFELMTPFFAALFGFIFFKESITIMQIIGILLLVFAVNFLSKKEN